MVHDVVAPPRVSDEPALSVVVVAVKTVADPVINRCEFAETISGVMVCAKFDDAVNPAAMVFETVTAPNTSAALVVVTWAVSLVPSLLVSPVKV